MTDTVVFFHAHPDDEAIFTGGTMATLADRGLRLVLVVATAGEGGEPSANERGRHRLARVRRAETLAAAARLGVTDVRFLGYEDSGMDGAAGFATAPVDEAGDRLAELLEDVGLGLAATSLGSATVEVNVAVDVAAVLDRKRAAMAPHGRQIPASSPTWQLPGASFSSVYGLEWFCRVGAAGRLDRLTP